MAKNNSQAIIQEIEQRQIRSDIPSFKAGDAVSVHVKLTENNRTRIQKFDGTVISKKGSGLRESITVRKITDGVGVEKSFFLNSPSISRIDVLRLGKVRRAKLFYLRDRKGKATRIKAA